MIKDAPLQIISMMCGGYFSKDEIIHKLDISSTNFYQSLNELRAAGFRVTSAGLTYHIYDFDDRLSLNYCDKSVLAYMINLACTLLPRHKFVTFKNLIRRLMFFGGKNDYNDIMKQFRLFRRAGLTDEYSEKILKLGEYIESEGVIKVILHSGKELFMQPKDLDWEQERIQLLYMDTKEPKEKDETIGLERIAKIVDKDEEEYIAQDKEVIFELYGRLAKSYLLKKDERVVDSTKISLVIASGAKDKEVLFKRLLRYDTMCRVLQTKKDVELFKKMIERSLDNIGARPDPDANDYSWEQTKY